MILSIDSTVEVREKGVANIHWKEDEDDICLAQLEAWRMCLQNVPRGDITKVKKDFVRNLRQNENVGNRTDYAIIKHFDFLDKLTLKEICEEGIPDKYIHLNGVNKTMGKN